MRNTKSTILENVEIAPGIYSMMIETEGSRFSRPGQFAMVQVPEKFLRRPISVCRFDGDRYTLVYRAVGDGTRIMSGMDAGQELDVLTGLGNGYDVSSIPQGAHIIGGGIGIPPMLGLVRALTMEGKRCKVILGYNSEKEIFLLDQFRDLCDDVTVMTADGSYGEKGFVTDAFDTADVACACGPLAMLKALSPKVKDGYFSLEARMGCGFGACMGCSVKTVDGSRRVCKEGPVFRKDELLWDQLV